MTAGLLTLVALSLLSQEPRSLVSVLEPIRSKHAVPALGAALLADGRVIALGAVGIRRLGHDNPVTTADCWHLGSCGKAMTATLCAHFVDHGMLGWDTTMPEAFPDLATAMHASFRSATVRQLLDHRAGLSADTSARGPFARELDRNDSARDQRRDVVRLALAEAPAYAPGTERRYSNLSFQIAGALLERIADAPFEQIVRDQLWQPLGMTTAGCGQPGRAGAAAAPCGHAVVLGRTIALDAEQSALAAPPWYTPAGDMHASLTDWARFVALHLAAEPTESLLRTATRDAMHTPVDDCGYACGFAVVNRDGSAHLAHHGQSNGWSAVVDMVPATHSACLVVCNQGGDTGKSACDDALVALTAAAVERPR